MGIKKLTLVIIYIFLVFLLLEKILAGDIEIDLSIKDGFYLDDKILFRYTFLSEADIKIKYYPGISCPYSSMALIQEKWVQLEKSIAFEGIYNDILVDDSIEPQTCIAYVKILDPIQKMAEKTFEIKTNPSFDFKIELNKKIFVKKEYVNVNFSSEVLNPRVQATLIYPNKKTEQITLPYSFKADQIGTYELEVTASKDDYKTITKKEQFGVIEKEAKIEYLKIDEIKKEKSKLWFWVPILSVIGIVSYLIYRKYYKQG